VTITRHRFAAMVERWRNSQRLEAAAQSKKGRSGSGQATGEAGLDAAFFYRASLRVSEPTSEKAGSAGNPG
jgi:hypothetical protein